MLFQCFIQQTFQGLLLLSHAGKKKTKKKKTSTLITQNSDNHSPMATGKITLSKVEPMSGTKRWIEALLRSTHLRHPLSLRDKISMRYELTCTSLVGQINLTGT